MFAFAAMTAIVIVFTHIASSTAGLAADVPAPPLKAAPPLSPPWAGFYVGVTAGYGWSHDSFSRTSILPGLPPLTVSDVDSKGGLVGGYAGYNWQYGRVVTGLEIDFTATDISGTSTGSTAGGTTSIVQSFGDRLKYLGSARARLGWTPVDSLLVYGTAGLAWERVDQTTGFVQSVQAGTSGSWQQTAADKFGWVGGIGAEVMLGNQNWIGRLEYLHYGMGNVAQTLSIPPISQTSGSQNIDVIRAGLAYKFGGTQPWTNAYASAAVTAPSALWTGFYIGGHGGYGWGQNPYAVPFSSLIGGGIGILTGESMSGWLAGAQIGYNWQYGSVVTGVEFDLSAADIDGTSSTATVSPGPGSTATGTLEHHVKYLGTIRGRLGWTPLNTVLLYGTAGLAWERLQEKSTEVDVVPAGTTVGEFISLDNHFGWVAGAGVEVMLGSPNWIGRLEYLHYDFGRVGDQAVNTAASQSAGRQTIDTVRAGVSYKFGPQGPATTSAQLYTKAPPAPSLQQWAGFYIGAHGGYGWKKNSFDGFASLIIAPIDGPDSRGFVAGGQAGYNWQYRQVVAGIEIDGSATGIKGTSGPGFIGTIASDVWSDEVKYLGTIRGRLGWTPLNNVLLYGTGGLAWERAHRTEIVTSTVTGGELVTTSRDHFGWAAGAGAEFMLGNSNWIGRIEYLHYDFGQVEPTFTFTSSTPGESSTENGGRQTINVVRAGVSYKFAP